jgi:replicative superfamily II helicase
LYGAETWTIWEVDQKYLKSFEVWCWRRMEKISWTDRVRNEEVLHRVKEERNILHTIKRKANWIGHILRRNCLLKHVIEGKLGGRIEMTGRRGRRRKPLLDDLKEKKILEIERGSTRSHCVENSLWKSLCTCRKTDYRMNK